MEDVAAQIQGRRVVQVCLSWFVDLVLAGDQVGPTLRLEGDFDVMRPDEVIRHVEDPGEGDAPRHVFALFQRTVVSVEILEDGALGVAFDDGHLLRWDSRDEWDIRC